MKGGPADLFWGLVIAAIAGVIITFFRNTGGNGRSSESPMDILKNSTQKRDHQEEYEGMKRDVN